jgi:hypothetical protein
VKKITLDMQNSKATECGRILAYTWYVLIVKVKEIKIVTELINKSKVTENFQENEKLHSYNQF